MKKLIFLKSVKHLSFTLLLLSAVSCTNETSPDSLTQENFDLPINAPDNLTGKTVCTVTSFPVLGPGALAGQTCVDVKSPINMGTLDCRVKDAGGYSELKVGSNTYGVYKLRGGKERYPDTRTRVERSFHEIDRAKGRSIKFTGKFVIPDVSDRATNIFQIHNGQGKVVAGLKVGQDLVSANFAVQVQKKKGETNKFNIFVSQTTVPYTSESAGKREQLFLVTIDKDKEYTLEVTVGYDNDTKLVKMADSKVRVFNSRTDKSLTLKHTFTGENFGVRYGAYEASDSGDTGSEVRYRGITFCRTN